MSRIANFVHDISEFIEGFGEFYNELFVIDDDIARTCRVIAVINDGSLGVFKKNGWIYF